MAQAKIELLADSRQIRTATNDLKRLEGQGRNTERGANALKNAFVALGGALAAQRVIQYADAYTSVQNSLRIVTNTSQELVAVQEKLLNIANSTRSSLDSTATLYATLSRNTEDLGLSQSRLLRVTDIINKSFAASGTSAQEASGAIRQLSQGLAAGALRGDEFNSVAEGAPEILRAVAAETGKNIGQLREFAATGGITAELLIRSLENYGEKLDEIFDKSERTFNQSLTVANNNLTTFVGELESGAGIVGGLGDTLVTLSENLDTLSKAGEVLAVVFGARLVGSLGASTTALVAKQRATVAAAAAELKAAQAANARALADQAAAQRSLAVARTETLRAGAITRLAIANQSAAGTTNVLSAATANYTRVAGTAAVASRGLSASMALIGGPVGVALLVAYGLYEAASAAGVFSDEQTKTEGEVQKVSDQLEEQISILQRWQQAKDKGAGREFAGLNVEQLTSQLETANNVIDIYQKRLDRLSQSGASAARIAELTEQIREQQVRVSEINKILPELADKAYKNVTQAIRDQIMAMQETDKAYEISIALRKVGTTAASEEGAEIVRLINEKYRLRDAQDAAAEAAKAEAAEISRLNADYAEFLRILERSEEVKARQIEQDANRFASLRQQIVLQQTQISLDNEQYELQRNLLALGEDDGTDLYAQRAAQITELTTQLQAMRFEAELIGQSLSQSFGDIGVNALDSVSQGLASIITQGASVQEVFHSIANTILNEMLTAIIRYAIGAAAQSVLSTGVTTSAQVAAGATVAAAWTPAAIAASIATGGATTTAGIAAISAGAPVAAGAIQATSVAGFERGGYTGSYGTKEVAGVVHGQEFVMNARATRANRGTLEAMNSGKSVGGDTYVNVTNNATNSNVSTEERQDEQGNRIIDIVVSNINQRGKIHRAMTQTTTASNRI